MKCTALTGPGAGGAFTATFAAIPRNLNKPEDHNFSNRATPTASASVVIDNAEYQSSIKVGDYYYVDIVRARGIVAG